MPIDSASHASRIDHVFRGLALCGLALIIISFVADALPNARPGFNSFQILLLCLGLLLALGATLLRRRKARGAFIKRVRGNLIASVILTALSLLALEILLTALGVPTHFPSEVPAVAYEPAPWWTCDEAGCHYVAEHIQDVCDNLTATVWPCVVNKQGFYDSQDFVASDALASQFRVIAMGDSFTFGLSAEAGKSYVDAIEAEVPNSVVWNTGISGIGTRQAVASFSAFAPIMKPHIALYGFYVNDFDDNLIPIDGYFVGVDDDRRPVGVRNHRVDIWGNLVKLDQSTAVYYHEHGLYPPASPLEHSLGKTRLGSLLLNAIETIGHNSGLTREARHEKRVAVTRESLIELRDAAAALDATLLIMLIPKKEDLIRPGLRHRTAIELFEALAIAYFNPIDALDVASHYAPEGDVHWNTAGHQKIGTMLGECLILYQERGDFSACAAVTTP